MTIASTRGSILCQLLMPATGLGAALSTMGEHRTDAWTTLSPRLDGEPTPIAWTARYITHPPGFAVILASEHTAILWKPRSYGELRQFFSSAIDELLGGDFPGVFHADTGL